MSLPEAKRLIAYINDDTMIANYLGGQAECWTPARVRRIRASMSVGKRPVSSAYRPPSPDLAIGYSTSVSLERLTATQGSAKLLAAILAYYAKHHPRAVKAA